MAITFVGTLAGSTTNGADITIALDATVTTTGGGLGGTVSAGDYMLAATHCIAQSTSGTFVDSDARPWASLGFVAHGTRRTRVDGLVAEDETGNSVVIEGTGLAADGMSALISVWRGIDTGTITISSSVTGTTGAPNAPEVVPPVDDCVIAQMYGNAVLDGTPGTSAGYTSTQLVQANDTNDTQVQWAWVQLTGQAGSSQNPGAWSAYSSSTAWAAFTVALAPAAAGETITVDKGDLTLAGSTIAVAEIERVTVDKGDLTLTGSNVAALEIERVTVDKGDLTLAGSAITVLEVELVPVAKADLTLTGSDIGETEHERLTIDAIALTLAGSDIIVIDPSEEQPSSGGHGNKDPWVYDRPYLSEFAEELRKLVQQDKIEEAEEVAEELVEAVQTVQAQVPLPMARDFAQLEAVALKLRHLSALDQRMRLNLARTLVIRAHIADQIRLDEEDAELLLMS